MIYQELNTYTPGPGAQGEATLPQALLPYSQEMLLRPGEIGHELYLAQYGDPDGTPLLLIHGTASPFHETQIRFIHTLPTRAILFHQRGVGLSRPSGELRENSTEYTIGDIEAIREHLGIDSWHIYGWSYGSTAATLYAQRHPNVCRGLLLSGVFMASEAEYESSMRKSMLLHPSRWEALARITGVSATLDGIGALFDAALGLVCGGCEEMGELAVRLLFGRQASPEEMQRFKVESHLKRHRFFIRQEDLKEGIREIAHIPTSIVRGLKDVQVLPGAAEDFAGLHGSASVYDVPDGHFFRNDASQQMLTGLMMRLLSGG